MTDRAFPERLSALLSADWGDIDFQPREDFMTQDMLRKRVVSWHGRDEGFDTTPFRVFGADSSGGLAAIWVMDSDAELLSQPVVQLDSTEDDYVVAVDFREFLWLVAAGIGPAEANDDYAHEAPTAVQALADLYAPDVSRRSFDIAAHARQAISFPAAGEVDGFETDFPKPLAKLLAMDFEYRDGDGIDFEPFLQFQSATENLSWVRSWTGNQELDGAEYRFFGSDGTGGLAGFFIAREGASLLEQPIVFFGSEGTVGLVAANFQDFLWLLADGFGPLEATEHEGVGAGVTPTFLRFATNEAPDAKKSAADVLARVNAEFPDFVTEIMELCR